MSINATTFPTEIAIELRYVYLHNKIRNKISQVKRELITQANFVYCENNKWYVSDIGIAFYKNVIGKPIENSSLTNAIKSLPKEPYLKLVVSNV